MTQNEWLGSLRRFDLTKERRRDKNERKPIRLHKTSTTLSSSHIYCSVRLTNVWRTQLYFYFYTVPVKGNRGRVSEKHIDPLLTQPRHR